MPNKPAYLIEGKAKGQSSIPIGDHIAEKVFRWAQVFCGWHPVNDYLYIQDAMREGFSPGAGKRGLCKQDQLLIAPEGIWYNRLENCGCHECFFNIGEWDSYFLSGDQSPCFKKWGLCGDKFKTK
jgi:hypothetical protein